MFIRHHRAPRSIGNEAKGAVCLQRFSATGDLSAFVSQFLEFNFHILSRLPVSKRIATFGTDQEIHLATAFGNAQGVVRRCWQLGRLN